MKKNKNLGVVMLLAIFITGIVLICVSIIQNLQRNNEAEQMNPERAIYLKYNSLMNSADSNTGQERQKFLRQAAQARYEWGKMYEDQAYIDEARSHYQAALGHDPHNKDALAGLDRLTYKE